MFRYAIATGKAERDSSTDLKGALAPVKAKHYASITDPRRIGELLKAIDGYIGFYPTMVALKFAPLVFVRPGELRHAEWNEFDLDGKLWRIPTEKMKMEAPHIVPLSRQVLDILNDLRHVTGHGRYLFPSVRASSRPMSNNTIITTNLVFSEWAKIFDSTSIATAIADRLVYNS